MRILLAQPLADLVDPGTWVRSCFMEPLGIEYVAGAAMRAGHDVICPHPIRTDAEFAEHVGAFAPDVLGLSVYSYALGQARRWAALAKHARPGLTVVFGGYHPSGDPRGVLDDHNVDFVVSGEGEDAFVQLLSALRTDRREVALPGVSYRSLDGSIESRPQERVLDLSTLATPYRQRSLLAQTASDQLLYPPRSMQRSVAQVLFGRGCNHCCAYCSSASIWGNTVLWRSPADVVDEIEALHRDYECNLVFFADLSITGNKERLEGLCRELIKRDLPVHWWAMCRVDEMTADILHLMKKAKACKITVGAEAAFPWRFGSSRASGIPWQKFNGALGAAHEVGLLVRATLQLDAPQATREWYDLVRSRLSEIHVDEMRFAFCTPFVGTGLRVGLDGGSESRRVDWSRFTTEMPIYCAGGLAVGELLSFRREYAEILYGSPIYVARMKEKIAAFPHLRDSYREFFAFAQGASLISKTVSDMLNKALVPPPKRTQPRAVQTGGLGGHNLFCA